MNYWQQFYKYIAGMQVGLFKPLTQFFWIQSQFNILLIIDSVDDGETRGWWSIPESLILYQVGIKIAPNVLLKLIIRFVFIQVFNSILN